MLRIMIVAVLLPILGCAGLDTAPGVGVAGLYSWNDGDSKQAIIDFVEAVSTPGSDDFLPEENRIAVFDNDGTLWAEQPMYFQFIYALDRVKAMAEGKPRWRTTQPFKAILEDDHEYLASMGHKEILDVVSATHAGMSVDAFAASVREWNAKARHPRFDQPYTSLTYKPMVELLGYLRANGFRSYIVSGGGIEFLRTFAWEAYGIPSQDVIGSSGKVRFEMTSSGPLLLKEPGINSINDKEGKPVNINLHIGQKPILAFGNADGDLQMLQYTDSGKGPRLALLLHHDDDEREWAYDRESHVGRLDKALDEAAERGWTVVSMKNDFERVFAFEE